MAIIKGDYYMQCGDCGVKERKSAMKFSKEYGKWICNFHKSFQKEIEFKEYKTHLATPRFKNKHATIFREDTHTWDFCHFMWEDDEGNWEDN